MQNQIIRITRATKRGRRKNGSSLENFLSYILNFVENIIADHPIRSLHLPAFLYSTSLLYTHTRVLFYFLIQDRCLWMNERTNYWMNESYVHKFTQHFACKQIQIIAVSFTTSHIIAIMIIIKTFAREIFCRIKFVTLVRSSLKEKTRTTTKNKVLIRTSQYIV